MLYDITQTKALMNEPEERATHDAMTGILNRATLLSWRSGTLTYTSAPGPTVLC